MFRCSRLFAATAIAASVTITGSAAPRALAYDISVAASNSGPALTPWAGLVNGQSYVTGYGQAPDGRRTWTSQSNMVVTPPIQPENWFPGPLAGRHAMYQLIQFLVDYFSGCYMPSQPTALGALTAYDLDNSMVATNADYGILITSSASASPGPIPRLDATMQSSTQVPFQYCLNAYTVRGRVTPNGPGSALTSGYAMLPLQDGSTMVLAVHGSYSFDPLLTLPAPYEFEHTGSFDLVLGEPQTWSIESTYSEWPAATASVASPFPVVRTTWGFLKGSELTR